MNVYESIMTGLTEAVGYEKGVVKARKTKCTVNPALPAKYDIIQMKKT